MLEEQARLCVVCDGAEWIGKHVQALFPAGRQVLDSYYCAEDLHWVAKPTMVYRCRPSNGSKLRCPGSPGKVSLVLRGLRRTQAQSDER